jgi:plastocyanin
VLAVVGDLSGCSTKQQSPAVPPAVATALAPAPASADPATIVGIAPPASNDVPSVVVLRSRIPLKYPSQPAKPMMDQVAHTFTPGVLLVRTGQPANFRNDDDVLHNVRVRAKDRDVTDMTFNIVLPQGGSYVHTFDRDGVYDVRCDMHQSMSALVVAASTPYSAVADRDGAFTIEGVQPGTYTLVVYAGERKIERSIDVAEGQRLELNIGGDEAPTTEPVR